MEPGTITAVADVVAVFDVMLNTDQFIVATHVAVILAIGIAQILVVSRGINAMERSGQRKLAVLDDLFKSLLHKLMTGEIRVADLDLSLLNIKPKEDVAA